MLSTKEAFESNTITSLWWASSTANDLPTELSLPSLRNKPMKQLPLVTNRTYLNPITSPRMTDFSLHIDWITF